MSKTKPQKLNITSFPYQEYDADGNLTYSEYSNGTWYKLEYDDNGNEIYYEDSDGYWHDNTILSGVCPY